MSRRAFSARALISSLSQAAFTIFAALTRAREAGAPAGRAAAAAGRTMVMSPAAPDSFLVILRFAADDGARAIGATDAAAAVELPGRRRRQPGSNAALRGCRCGATGPRPPTPRVESRVQIRILAALILVSHFSRVIFRTFGRKAVAKSGRCTSRWRIRRSTYFRSARGVAGLALAANWLRIVEAAKD